MGLAAPLIFQGILAVLGADVVLLRDTLVVAIEPEDANHVGDEVLEVHDLDGSRAQLLAMRTAESCQAPLDQPLSSEATPPHVSERLE